jgi:hypothetical protein
LDIWLSNGEPKSEPKGEPKKCLTSTVGGDKEGIHQKKINKNNTLNGVMVETRGSLQKNVSHPECNIKY